MQIIITNSQGSFDATELITSVQWSGSIGQCARTLAFGLLSAEQFGMVDCSLGSGVMFKEAGTILFDGYIVERTKSTVDSIIDITCFDRGYWLKQNQISRSFAAETPESATAAIAAEFNISCGDVAATGLSVSRNFLGGYSLYDIISTLYTIASEQNGKKYIVTFSGAQLCVREIGTGTMVYIEGGSNLMDATITESSKNLVNSVLVLDKNGNALYTQTDDTSIASYGIMQQAVKQQDNIDINAVVAETLKAAMPEQKITVSCLGNVNCITGAAVTLHEPVTNLYGKFFIDSDTHQWKNGIYTCKLVLTLQAVMDAKSAGATDAAGTSSQYAAALDKL